MKLLNRVAVFAAMAMIGLAPAAAMAASAYSGEYAGTFDMKGAGDGKINDKGDTIPPQNGDLKIKIGDDGKITGTVDNKTLKEQGEVSGTVSDVGEISVTIKYKEQDPSTVTGTVTNPKDGSMKGTLTQDIGKTTVIVKIDLKK